MERLALHKGKTEINKKEKKVDYSRLLKRNQKYLSSLKKKLKGKKVLIYGAGELFRYVYKNFDFSDINIAAISDRALNNLKGETFYGFKIVETTRIKEFQPDCILISTLAWQGLLLKNWERKIFDSKTPIYPLIKHNDRGCCDLVHYLFNIFPTYKIAKLILNSKLEVQNNYKKLEKNIIKRRDKRRNKKVRVGFLCYDDNRWKYQSLYDLLKIDDDFEPVILMTKLYTKKENRIQTREEFFKAYNFFKENNMNVELAYDIKKDKYLDLKLFSLDWLFYELPFYLDKTQAPFRTSKFAFTAYVPYYTGTSLCETVDSMDIRNQLYRYYLPDYGLKEFYSSIMPNKGSNIKVVGHPALDIFYKNNCKIKPDPQKFKVLYCPHHSIEDDSPIHLSTFLENGKFILDYALKHPEIEWVFRPHPLLKKVLRDFWSEKEIEDYCSLWQKAGTYDTEGDYTQTFLTSDIMINDCDFFPEFFPTGRPIIQLINPKVCPHDKVSAEIISTCYQSHNNEELRKYFELLIEKRQDPMEQERLNLLEKLNIINNCAALNIINDMRKSINE